LGDIADFWKLVLFWCQPNIDKHVVRDNLVADVIEIGTTLVDTDGHTNEKFVADTVAMATKNSHHKEKNNEEIQDMRKYHYFSASIVTQGHILN
jgi:hypothetical protein